MEREGGTGESGAADVVDSGEAESWARLAQEDAAADGETIEAEESEQPAEKAEAEAEKPEGEAEEDEKADDKAAAEKAKLPAEEIEKRYRNLQGALNEERQNRKAMADTIANMKAVIRQMLDQSPAKQPAAAEPEVPDVNENPVGFFMAKLAEQQKVIEELRTGSQQTRQQIEQRQHEEQFWSRVQHSEVEARKSISDYDAAVEHLEKGRIAELELLLPDDSEVAQQAAQEAGFKTVAQLRVATLNQDRTSIAAQAMRSGRSPAEVYYQLAKQRGYAPKPAKSQMSAVEATRAGQAAAKTLSAGRGEANSGALSIKDLADLYITDPERADREFKRARERGLIG